MGSKLVKGFYKIVELSSGLVGDWTGRRHEGLFICIFSQSKHEGTTDVKRCRINTLTHEYELFRMNGNESIQDMQKRFIHIVNHLASLGKKFQNEDLINQVLRCLSREWKLKATAITESRDLSNMSLATLFGKLQEHNMELLRLNSS